MRRLAALTFAFMALLSLATAPAQASPYADQESSVVVADDAPVLNASTAVKASSAKGLSLAACNKVVKTAWIYAPPGWTFRCSWSMPANTRGWTYKHETVVRAGMTYAMTRSVAAHEQAHIWSLSKLTYAQMDWFSKQVGKKHFFDGGVYTMPAERWAATQATCAGYPEANVKYPKVPCSLLTETLKH